MTAQEYWDKKGCRLLVGPYNRVPTVEEWIKAAFISGFKVGVEHSRNFVPSKEHECYVKDENTQ
jgi:hypothetical protein